MQQTLLYQQDTECGGARVEPWFALRVKSNFERTAATLLRHKGYREFLPTYRSRRRWSDRVKEIEAPLFPGYVFCRFNPLNRFPILATPGVVNIVGIGKVPQAVDEREIQAIWTILESGVLAKPWPFLQVGQRVLIGKGPLKGVEGILTEFKNRCRIVISITLLQRSIAAEIDGDWVRPVGKATSSMPMGRVGVEVKADRISRAVF